MLRAARDKSRFRGRLLVHVLSSLLQQQEGAAVEEGGEGALHRQDGESIVEAGVKATEHVKNLVAAGDELAEVVEAVGAVLEAGEVGDDGGASLLDAPELRREEHRLVLPVLQKQIGDGVPELRSRGMALMIKPKISGLTR